MTAAQTNRTYTSGTVDVCFEPLSLKTVEAAIALANATFPECLPFLENPETEYRASLDPRTHRRELDVLGLQLQQHWVVRRNESIIGLTGLQRKWADDRRILWLGWFCLAPHVRGLGIGAHMLAWTISTARRAGCHTLKLETSDLPSETVAQMLYEKFDFHLIASRWDPERKYTRLFRQKNL